MLIRIRRPDGGVENLPLDEVTHVTVLPGGAGVVHVRFQVEPFVTLKDPSKVIAGLQARAALPERVTVTGDPTALFDLIFGRR